MAGQPVPIIQATRVTATAAGIWFRSVSFADDECVRSLFLAVSGQNCLLRTTYLRLTMLPL
jgi:hypothetical protein